VAAALGGHGEDVVQFKDLEPALARAAGAGKPACVSVMIERVAAPRFA
jgi:acetolactate synthase-1/2/3 large subunit